MSRLASPFRPGDIRGIYPDEINEQFVTQFAHAFCGKFDCNVIATGRDTRPSSAALYEALTSTLSSIGIRVLDMGICPTELGYFASSCQEVDGALIITASHNPENYNGIKAVVNNGRGIADSLADIEALIEGGYKHAPGNGSTIESNLVTRYADFVEELFKDLEFDHLVAVNGVGGTAPVIANQLADRLNIKLAWLGDPGDAVFDADPGSPANRAKQKSFMDGGQYALGVGWDGDCDRCEFYNADGDSIPAYYVIGLFVAEFLSSSPGAAIVYDTRLCWNTLDTIARHGGVPVASPTGQAFMGRKMAESNAVYGGEISSHHYFATFMGCDSGMMTMLTMLRLLSGAGQSLDELVDVHRNNVSCTPEISLSLHHVNEAFKEVSRVYSARALRTSAFDGMSFEMPGDWRFSIRQSRTEPLVRLNFECRNQPDQMLAGAEEVLEVLQPFSADSSRWPGQLHTV